MKNTGKEAENEKLMLKGALDKARTEVAKASEKQNMKLNWQN